MKHISNDSILQFPLMATCPRHAPQLCWVLGKDWTAKTLREMKPVQKVKEAIKRNTMFKQDLNMVFLLIASLLDIKNLIISLTVSGRYLENPAIWLVPGAGSIFLSPDHGYGNQLR